MTVKCSVCGRAILRRKDRLPKQPACGYKCNGVNRGREWAQHGYKGAKARTPESYQRAAMRGPKNPAWKGGVTFFKTKGNYKDIPYVRAPEDVRPMARKDGYIMEHRLVMARRLGRLLTRTEVVHHLDHDPTNNSPENLELWPSNGSHRMGEVGRFVPGVANRVFLAV